MARLDDLEFVITANTAALRNDLARGSDAVNGFAAKTEAVLNRHQLSLEHISRSIRRVVELYGAVRAVEAFGRQIESATQLNKLTQEQADKLAGARDAVEQLGDAWEEMWRRAALKGAGFFEIVARGAARTLEDVSGGPSDRAGQIAAVQQQIAQANASIKFMERTHNDTGIDFYRQKLDALWETFKKLQAGASEADKTIGQINWEKKLEGLQDIVISGKTTTAGELFNLPGTDMLDRAAKLAEQLKTPLEKDLETLKEIRELVDAGLLKPEAVQRFAEQKLTGIENAGGALKELKEPLSEATKRAKEFASTFTASFESRGIQAFLDGDLRGAVRGLAQDFAELIIKLLVLKPLAEQVASSITGMSGEGTSSGGGSFWASLIGAFGFANGGRPPVGVPSWIGEKGPELWVPDSAGTIIPNGGVGGTTIMQNFYVQAGLPPQWDVQLAGVTRIAATAAYEAVTNRLGGRR